MVYSFNVRICRWINAIASGYLLLNGILIFSTFPSSIGGKTGVERQCGYKNLKLLKSIQVVASMVGFGKGTGGINSDGDLHWHGGV